uniref:CAB/ELIP/HLIP superfamily protein n=1 Tax=Rhodaphanes brevistipitata TaxID=446136 RepID=UPI001FCDD34F|nr:CAB/ELIP/HLIP superfamily protein [Rhodaphanes brevistipitata]UNJ18573.1 CAB/ELIP/HLIP superfamily protein [Rhodaphanes brevistipitata]
MHEKDPNLWTWGFTYGAENWNGRLAMLGCLFMFLTELISQENILYFLGILK